MAEQSSRRTAANEDPGRPAVAGTRLPLRHPARRLKKLREQHQTVTRQEALAVTLTDHLRVGTLQGDYSFRRSTAAKLCNQA